MCYHRLKQWDIGGEWYLEIYHPPCILYAWLFYKPTTSLIKGEKTDHQRTTYKIYFWNMWWDWIKLFHLQEKNQEPFSYAILYYFSLQNPFPRNTSKLKTLFPFLISSPFQSRLWNVRWLDRIPIYPNLKQMPSAHILLWRSQTMWWPPGLRRALRNSPTETERKILRNNFI